jgi:hypothetical protein
MRVDEIFQNYLESKTGSRIIVTQNFSSIHCMAEEVSGNLERIKSSKRDNNKHLLISFKPFSIHSLLIDNTFKTNYVCN